MKNLILASTLALISFSSFAAVSVEEGYRIDDPSKQLLPQLKLRQDITFDHVNSKGYVVYGPKGLGRWLEMNNIAGENIVLSNDDKAATDVGFISHEELGNYLMSLEARFPKIAKVMSLGKSVKGRDLWAIKISKNVELDEVEPEFKYIANMHGDEITGRELTMRFATEILENYGKNSRISSLIDNTEIFIVPTMNPDGMSTKRRGNANNTDLNRSFPEFTRGDQNTTDGRPVEVQHMMRFQDQHHFALSANFHGGAVVVNYPWDAVAELHPLDRLLAGLSKEYADTNSEMRNSTEFDGGITNGYAWYELRGGMQDWSYRWYGDLQITLEVSEIKWINSTMIDSFYKDNRDSMLNFMARVHQGAGFKLQDKSANGKVKVLDARGKNLGEFTFNGGEFYKVLEPGNYTYEITIGRMLKTLPVTVTDEISPHGNYQTL